MSEDVVTNLLKRVAELERIVAILTREYDSKPPAAHGPLDHTPPLYPQPLRPTIPVIPNTPAIGANPRCQACGIELSSVMGYVCSRGTGCPTGLGGAVCTGGA